MIKGRRGISGIGFISKACAHALMMSDFIFLEMSKVFQHLHGQGRLFYCDRRSVTRTRDREILAKFLMDMSILLS